MKILAETKKFDVEKAIEEIKKAHLETVKGTHAEQIGLRTEELFTALGDLYPKVTFILLDDEETIMGWRN